MNQAKPQKPLLRITVIVVGLIVLGLVGVRAIALLSGGNQAATSAEQGFRGGFGTTAVPVGVTVERASLNSVEELTVLPGTLEPQFQVDVLPRRAGRLEAVDVEVGRRVERGDILATVEHAELLLQNQQSTAGLSASNSSLRRTESQLDKVRTDYERVKQLHEHGAATEQELKNALNQLNETEIQLDVARSQYEQATANHQMMQLQLQHVHIDAPVTGVVTRSAAVIGSYVGTSTAVATIAGLDPIEVVFHFPERRLDELTINQPFTVNVDAYPNESFLGQVTHLDAGIDPLTRTVAVRGQVPNPDLRLRPGMFARIELVVARAEGAVTIPREALMTGSDGYFVYVVEDDQARVRPILLGVQGRDRLQVLSGVQESDIVVVVGQQGLRDRQIVRPLGGENL